MNHNQQPSQPSDHLHNPIKYGDLFPVQGDLAGEPIRPGDAALMQTAESLITGKNQKGGAASIMQSAATLNERAGIQGVTVTETDTPGRRIVNERFAVPTAEPLEEDDSSEKITMGEALEVAGLSQSDKPVEQSDVAAIQAAEVTAIKIMAPEGVTAAAQSAVEMNDGIVREEDKITIGELLSDATVKLVSDKEVTREDAERVVEAELRNSPDLNTVAGGVADSVMVAALLNEKMNKA